MGLPPWQIVLPYPTTPRGRRREVSKPLDSATLRFVEDSHLNGARKTVPYSSGSLPRTGKGSATAGSSAPAALT